MDVEQRDNRETADVGMEETDREPHEQRVTVASEEGQTSMGTAMHIDSHSRFFLFGCQIDRLAVVEHLDTVWDVGFREGHTRMLHRPPLTTLRWFFGIPPQKGLHGVL